MLGSRPAKTPVFIEEILTIPEGQHVLTFLKDGREVSSQFLATTPSSMS